MWLFAVLGLALIVGIGLVLIGRETARLAASPRPAVFDMTEAVEFIADRLPADTQARISHDDVRWILLADAELLEEATGGTGAIGEQIAHLRSEATDLVRELARIVHDEPPEVVEREGLLKAVDAACRSAERPGLRVGFHVSGRPRETGRHVAELLYRAVLEGTANVARHAAANHCLVRLAFSASHVTLQVSDNGHGAIQERALPGGSGLGLASLQQAARRLHGEAYLQSRAGAGARLVVKLPLPDGPRPLASGGRKKRGRG